MLVPISEQQVTMDLFGYWNENFKVWVVPGGCIVTCLQPTTIHCDDGDIPNIGSSVTQLPGEGITH